MATLVCIGAALYALVSSEYLPLPPFAGGEEETVATPTPPPLTEAPDEPTAAAAPTELPTPAEEGPYTVCEEGCAYADLGAAIAAAAPTETVTVGPGTYTANLTLDQPLTVRGEGPDQTHVEALTSAPVFIIDSDDPIAVTLQGLSIEGGNASGEAVGCLPAPQDCENGVVVLGSAQVAVRNVAIRDHADTGLWARDESQVTLSNSEIAENHVAGIAIADSAGVILDNTTVTGNDGTSLVSAGIRIDENASLTLANSIVTRNSYAGIWAQGSAALDIRDSEISRNTGGADIGSGLVLDGAASAMVQRTDIVENGTDTACLNDGSDATLCNGVLLAGQAQLDITASTLASNIDWGLAARMTDCGYSADLYAGSVEFGVGMVVESNSLGGNQAGVGNPGVHDWKTSPDGQICLATSPGLSVEQTPFDDLSLEPGP